MTRNLLTPGLAFLVVFLAPAAAYHIDGNAVTTGGAMTSADWEAGPSSVVLCESNGEHSSRNPVAGGRHGLSALCTTGENDATGVAKPPTRPAKGAYVELDTCTLRTAFRFGGDCSGGDRSTYGFTAEIGSYSCDVQAGQALFYDRTYAWWIYDGEASYYPGDAPGDAENGGPPAMMPVPNNEDAFHGHVAVFVDAPLGATGSVVTDLTGVTWSSASNPERCDSAIGSDGTPVFVADDS